MCYHGESVSDGVQANTTALMYKMRERRREREQGNVQRLIDLLCVSVRTVSVNTTETIYSYVICV